MTGKPVFSTCGRARRRCRSAYTLGAPARRARTWRPGWPRRAIPTARRRAAPPTWCVAAGGREWALSEARERHVAGRDRHCPPSTSTRKRGTEPDGAREIHRPDLRGRSERSRGSRAAVWCRAERAQQPCTRPSADRRPPTSTAVGGRGADGAAYRATWLPAAGPGRLVEGRAATNVTMDAEDLLLRQFLGIRDRPARPREAARWIRPQQRDDGTWANFHGGPGDLSTTVEACGRAAAGRRRRRTRRTWPAPRRVRPARGRRRAQPVFTRIWLALFGLWSWDDLPDLPPEMIFLPLLVPAQRLRLGLLGPADRGAADRSSARSGRCAPCRSTSTSCAPARLPPAGRAVDWTGSSSAPTALLKFYGRHGPAVCANWPCGARREWILARQGGRRSGRHPAAVGATRCSALHLLGYPLDHPATWPRPRRPRRASPSARRRRTAGCGGWRPASRRCGTPCSPLVALLDAGAPANDAGVRRAPPSWMLGEEIAIRN